MIRVGLELTGLELDRAGSARAVEGLREALARRDDVEIAPFAQPSQRAGRIARGLARELVWFPLILPRRAAGVDLLHCPMPLAPPRPRVPLVVTLYDTLPWERPEWFGRAIVLQHRTSLRAAVRRAARVLVPSEHTKERVRSVLGIASDRVDVAPLGLGDQFTPDGTARSANRPYILTVGTLQPRKNLELAVAAFERLPSSLDHRLVVVGARGWRERDLLRRVESSPAAGRIELTGWVEEHELVELYRGAECLVLPSRAEGFGFPVLEAMACGTPVMCARAGALPETAGGAALLFDPDNVGKLADELGELLCDSRLRDELRRRGLERARDFSWDRCAELTVAAYRAALDR